MSEVEEEKEKPVAGKKRKHSSMSKPSKPNVSQVKTKLLSFQSSADTPMSETSSYLHETLDFLRPEKLQDLNGNKLTSPNYDKCTLKVPSEFLKKQTPAMHQWWSLKSKHFDVILFFKVLPLYFHFL